MKKLLEAVTAHTRAGVSIREFDSWLQDWFRFKSSNQRFIGLDRPTDVDPKDVTNGDIFLLAPQLLGRNTRPLMVLVMESAALWDSNNYTEDDDCTVVIPFSPLSKPAFRFELEVDSGNVIQVWNTRCVPNNHLANAWKMGTADQDTLDDVYDVYMYQQYIETNGVSGKPLPVRLLSRVCESSNPGELSFQTEYYNQECELADNLEL